MPHFLSRISIMAWLVIISLVLHAIFFFGYLPHARSRMELNRAEEAQRSEEVRKREIARKEVERKIREQRQLTPEQARILKKDAERRRKAELEKKVEAMKRDLEDLEKLREEKFAQIKAREAKDIRLAQIDRLRMKAREMSSAMRSNFLPLPEQEPGEKERAAQGDENIHAQIEELAPNMEEWIPRVTELAGSARSHGEMMRLFGGREHAAVREGERNRQPIAHGFRRASGAENTSRLAIELAELAESLLPPPVLAEVNAIPEPEKPEPTPENDDSETADLAKASDVLDAYQTAQELEQQVTDAYRDIQAADTAINQGTSLEEALEQTQIEAPERPDLSESLAGSDTETVGEFDQFRQAVNEAVNQTSDMATRSKSLADQATGRSSEAAAPGSESPSTEAASDPAQNAAATVQRRMAIGQMARQRGAQVVDFTQILAGSSATDDAARRVDGSGGAGGGPPPPGTSNLPEIKINQGNVQARALPGRRLTDSALRTGYVYLDTWYVIGPWENQGDLYFTKKHPPEDVIDFDAEYRDGKFGGKEGHPDQVLRWTFYQSDQIRNEPIRVYDNATWYAYTEIWSDQAREILIAVASDDASRLWLNGDLIVDDTGGSQYRMGEGFRKVPLQRGYNKLLLRLENGPLYAVWSVLICPIDLLVESR